jgi:hypothetical protein
MSRDKPRAGGLLAGMRGGWRGSLRKGVGAGARRRTRLERVPSLAAIALPVAWDAVDDAGVGNKGDDAHAGAAGASQRIRFQDFPDQSSPGAAGLPGEVGIVPRLGRGSAKAGAVGLLARADDSAPVGIRAVEALAVASGIGDVGGDAVNPLVRIEHKPGGPGARVRGVSRDSEPSWSFRSASMARAGLYGAISRRSRPASRSTPIVRMARCVGSW